MLAPRRGQGGLTSKQHVDGFHTSYAVSTQAACFSAHLSVQKLKDSQKALPCLPMYVFTPPSSQLLITWKLEHSEPGLEGFDQIQCLDSMLQRLETSSRSIREMQSLQFLELFP